MMPKISVLMSVYNGEKYVACAIDSILCQTYKDFEFIIINDGSKDKTKNIIMSYDDERIVYIEQQNIGLTKSLNKGILLSKGEYIARIDADDYSMPTRLEKQIEYMDKNTECAVLGTYNCMYNILSGNVEYMRYDLGYENIKKFMAVRGTPFRHSSIMLRKCMMDCVGYYNENFIQAQDYEYWVRLTRYYKAAILPEYLCVSRRNISESIVGKRKIIENTILTYKIKINALKIYGFSKKYYFQIIKYTIINMLPKKIIPEKHLFRIRSILNRWEDDENILKKVDNEISKYIRIVASYK